MRAGLLTVLTCAFGILGGCGPDARPHARCRLEPTFVVTIRPEEGRGFPKGTRITFEYGGTRETYTIGQSYTPRVVFCESRPSPAASGEGNPQDSADAAGAGGERSTGDVGEIHCELWTYGSTDVDVEASGFGPLAEQDRLLELEREGDECTVEKTLIVPLLEPEAHP